MLLFTNRTRTHLCINVAVWATKGMHTVTDRDRTSIDTQVHNIIERCIAGRRLVVDRNGTSNGILSLLEVQVLPDPPDTINVGMVKEESWITGRSEEITSWVAANGEVATGVNAEIAGGEVALKSAEEGGSVFAVLDEVDGVGVFGPALGGLDGDITAKTAGVVAQAGPGRRVQRHIGESGDNGAKVDRPAATILAFVVQVSCTGNKHTP